ncbi:LacI family DNA-binding transcriptional regulator [Spirochaeta isovalerica]|uniref:DNA-binding LacI/PurR family transcriptional regulator n=1 Tax=Spirochaeta isovalerica TaxID=150 RepID=A0A841RE10_9SPIO|nr:LacI family DNA-binding transcriptional regulator [Spirochaeta isovalerica]MBB6481079.1 DNA-binding LacI/PurR family transcriptional regulator [Spirochaeta isovalerica]
MAVTIKDVADRAGVSPSTVSRVIHNNPKISEETKLIVNKAMEDLKYHPNAVARSLANSSTQTIGLILPNSSDDLFTRPFFIEAMRGISIYAQNQNYNLMYCFSNSEEEEVEFIRNYINSGWVDGIVLFTARKDDKCISYLQRREFPFVVIGEPENGDEILWVDNDNVQSMYNVTSYLVEKGFRRIGLITGPDQFAVTRNRREGYRQALISRKIDIVESLIKTGDSFSEETGYQCMKELLSLKNPPEAIAAADDYLAFGAMKAMDESGKQLPIIGFNNSPRADFLTPSLSSVDINPVLLGENAVQLLIKSLQNKVLPFKNVIVGTRLIERESTSSY